MISAVILNYLNPDLTCKSVDRLLKAAAESGIDVEVIIVDNSASRTAETLYEILPRNVIIIENEENEGFSKANNQGVKRAAGDIILIMNNDLFINADVLKKGVRYLENHRETGIWAPKLTDQQGKPQRSCAYFPTLTALFAEYLLKIPHHTRISKTAIEASKPMKVDSVIGACMFIPQKVMQKTGGFDEDYFFNVEDIDLCLQISKYGYNVIFDPRCAAVHLVSASQPTEWYNDPYLHQSRILFFRKNHHPLKAFTAKVLIKTGILLRKAKHKLFN